MGWELLTKVYGLSPDRLYVTYFEGDATLKLKPDLEAKKLWLDIGVPEDHIIPGNSKDNFWEMGDQGPCGPCSEIHYDRIGGRNAASLVNQDDPDVLEIWNLVFMQFNREPDRSLKPLPNAHVDTGMGLERLVSVLQDKRSNYDTDVFGGIFSKIQELTGARPYTGLVGKDDLDGIDTAYRVVADHVRTLTFALSDGGIPSNDGRGYVLRRILRRGARYVRKKFDVPIGNFFSRLADTVIAEMGEAFPELTNRVDEVKEILDEEEKSFAKTLDRGERLFSDYLEKTKSSGSSIMNGADVWRLYDTYGFPSDLTRLMAEENGIKINEAEFEKEKEISKEKSKGISSRSGEEVIALDIHALGDLEKKLAVPITNDSFKYGLLLLFYLLGSDDIESSILAIYFKKSFIQNFNNLEGQRVGLILDRTNFYAESGGQTFDTGSITIDGKADFSVEDVQVFGGYVLHIGYLKYGEISVKDKVLCSFDELRRWPLRNNHTGTHILNFALLETVGSGVDQKGSLVAPDKLRFDFSCKSALSVTQVKNVEKIVNEMIRKNMKVYYQDVPLAIAKSISGVRAVFGEVRHELLNVGVP